MAIPKRKPKHPYITQREGFAGGKPAIQGTRIKVSQIVTEYERLGWTPDEIVEAHPHLTLAQIHDALAYYYDHVEEIELQMKEEARFVEEMKKGRISILERKHGENPDLRR